MKWFYDLKIRTKLWVSFLLVALIAGYTGYYVGMGIVLAIGIALAIFLGFLIDRVISNPVKKLAEAADKIALGDVDQKIAIDAKDEIGNLASSFGKIVDSQKELIQAAIRIAAGDTSVKVEARSDKDALSKSFQQLLQTMQGLIAETSQLVQWAKDGQLDKRSDPAKFQGGYATLIRGINETLDAVMAPINEAAGVLEKVAARDLTAQVKGDYKGDHAKIKDALNTAVQNLDEGLLQVAVGAEQVASASSQISSGSQSLAHSTSEQAASLEEVSSSLQEMTSMTKQNAANAKKARRLSEGVRASAEKGMGSMQCLSQAMDKIKASSGETAKIVKTIDEIAFQTNLLALNAAVEAARAGDAGRGFAVVAEEVRNLAMRSAEAAKNTANMIEESIKNAENGVALNHEVLKNFADIHHQVNKVSEVMVEIAAASDQQSQGIDQIDTAVEQLNQTTQQTAANAEESASAAEDLSEQAEMMRNMVAGFKLSNAGGSATGLIPRPATHPRRAPTPQPKKPERTPASMWATRKDSNGHACPEDPKLLVPFQDDDETVLQEF